MDKLQRGSPRGKSIGPLSILNISFLSSVTNAIGAPESFWEKSNPGLNPVNEKSNLKEEWTSIMLNTGNSLLSPTTIPFRIKPKRRTSGNSSSVVNNSSLKSVNSIVRDQLCPAKVARYESFLYRQNLHPELVSKVMHQVAKENDIKSFILDLKKEGSVSLDLDDPWRLWNGTFFEMVEVLSIVVERYLLGNDSQSKNLFHDIENQKGDKKTVLNLLSEMTASAIQNGNVFLNVNWQSPNHGYTQLHLRTKTESNSFDTIENGDEHTIGMVRIYFSRRNDDHGEGENHTGTTVRSFLTTKRLLARRFSFSVTHLQWVNGGMKESEHLVLDLPE